VDVDAVVLGRPFLQPNRFRKQNQNRQSV
jgi:hypothetical protein